MASKTYAPSHTCTIILCPDCGQDFRVANKQQFPFNTYTGQLTKRRADDIIKAHAESIKNNYSRIRANLDTRGDKILTRWRNSFSKKARRDAITKALPRLQEKKLAHINAYFLLVQGKKVEKREQYRQTFLLPYLNIEESVQVPSSLFRLLELRRTTAPSRWAWIDYQSTKLPLESDMLGMKFSVSYYTTESGAYGQSVIYQKEASHQWQSIGFPTAEILFEAQRDLYHLLSSLVESVLEKAEAGGPGKELWLPKAKTNFLEYVPNALVDKHIESSILVPAQPWPAPASYDLAEIVAAATIFQIDIALDPTEANSAVKVIFRSQYFGFKDDVEKWSAIALEFTQPLLFRTRVWSKLLLYVDMIRVLGNTNTSADMTMLSSLIDILYTKELRHHIVSSLQKDGAFDRLFKSPPTPAEFNYTGESIAQWREDGVEAHQANQFNHEMSPAEFAERTLLWAVTDLSLYNGSNSLFGFLKDELPVLDDFFSVPNNALPPGSRVHGLLKDVSTILWIQNILTTFPPRPIGASMSKGAQLLAMKGAYVDKARAQRIQTGGKVYMTTLHNFDPLEGQEQKEQLTRSQQDAAEKKVYKQKQKQLQKRMETVGKFLQAFYQFNLPSRRKTPDWFEKAKGAKLALDAFGQEVRRLRIASILLDAPGEKQNTIEAWQDVQVLDSYKETDFLESVARDHYELAMQLEKDAANAQETEATKIAEEKCRVDD